MNESTEMITPGILRTGVAQLVESTSEILSIYNQNLDRIVRDFADRIVGDSLALRGLVWTRLKFTNHLPDGRLAVLVYYNPQGDYKPFRMLKDATTHAHLEAMAPLYPLMMMSWAVEKQNRYDWTREELQR